MAKNKVFRLSESDVKIIMESVTKRVLKEGSSETSDAVTWDDVKEMIGAENMLDFLWEYLTADQIKDFLNYAQRTMSTDSIEMGNDEEEDYFDDEEDFEDEHEYADDDYDEMSDEYSTHSPIYK